MTEDKLMFQDTVAHDFSVREPLMPELDATIARRYSPRKFKRVPLNEAVVKTLFDAARQAPSCFNEQPWRFYCSSDSSFEQFLTMLVPANEAWAKDASLIAIITAKKQFARNAKPNPHSWFDSGAAWYSLAYQARTMGLYTHAMAGIKKDEIIAQLNIADDEDVICAVAVGVVDAESADSETISERKALDDILTIVS